MKVFFNAYGYRETKTWACADCGNFWACGADLAVNESVARHIKECANRPEDWVLPIQLEKLRKRVEQLEVQLAGCMTAATGWAKDPPTQGDYGWSPAFQVVLNLRERYELLLRSTR